MLTSWPESIERVAGADRPVADLVRAARQQPAQFAAIYDLFVDNVYRYMMARTGQAADAQDLTQQTFLAALEALPRYDERFPFASWLFGIARHKVTDFYRRRRPESDLGAAALVQSHERLPDEQVGDQMQIDQVARKLRLLAPDRAEALTMRLFADLSVAEIAFLLGKQEPAVRMLIFRGMADLRRQLGRVSEAL
ncbi:MAG: sigma-70 family RNA polymerase sigma factor [Anaerolineales bacterium]|nr:sigma-70 family RNA polymerase sigma factor [Anaerolineales bacterium]